MEELRFLCGPCRDVVSRGTRLVVSSIRESVKRGLEPGGRRIAVVKSRCQGTDDDTAGWKKAQRVL
jgi:hypothetical protein